MMHDIIIIGAGPAGLTAALYARRMGKSVLLLEKATFGGQITYSPKIENYPGTPVMSGNEFADKLVEQVLALGADAELETVTGIENANAPVKTVVTEDGRHECRAIIIATGVKHRRLGLPGEDEFVGNGISYCAVCDGAFYKGGHVAVVGGGNSALQEALFLADICTRVTIVQNLPFLTGEQSLQDTIAARGNIDIITGVTVGELHGGETLTGITLVREDGETSELTVDGVFVAIGLEPENAAFGGIAALDARGYFAPLDGCTTKTPGVFTAGDCRAKDVRQITTAIGDGATAAVGVCRYLER
jgi:thioredoxin reductase (NADPH)